MPHHSFFSRIVTLRMKAYGLLHVRAAASRGGRKHKANGGAGWPDVVALQCLARVPLSRLIPKPHGSGERVYKEAEACGGGGSGRGSHNIIALEEHLKDLQKCYVRRETAHKSAEDLRHVWEAREQVPRFKADCKLQSSLPELTAKTYLEHIVELGPPSAVEKEGLLYMQTVHGENKPVFLFQLLPLTIIHVWAVYC
ncbi:hypothetical protein GOP47_0004322 [Adiantum capillus-veneris]|uniref:Uncharacterized protein n=1 Tax=Adiantum capillus-veneris TaxID=13818 RepID=A0A9D4V7V9_ADICA|nr:hypothetical protein GOP47_0004322 [Adiantum capillus-veneris]